jgi:hypothetical protein
VVSQRNYPFRVWSCFSNQTGWKDPFRHWFIFPLLEKEQSTQLTNTLTEHQIPSNLTYFEYTFPLSHLQQRWCPSKRTIHNRFWVQNALKVHSRDRSSSG